MRPVIAGVVGLPQCPRSLHFSPPKWAYAPMSWLQDFKEKIAGKIMSRLKETQINLPKRLALSQCISIPE